MLNRTGDADSDIESGRDHLAGLADLPIIWRVTSIDRGARGAHRRAKLVRDGLDKGLEILRALHATAAGYDDLGRTEFRTFGFDERFVLETRNLRSSGNGERFDRSFGACTGWLKRGGSHREDFFKIRGLHGFYRVSGIDLSLIHI